MGAIVGLVGQGSMTELHAMLAMMPHRGEHVSCWSPAPSVYFGCRSAGPVTQRSLVWEQDLIGAVDEDPDTVERSLTGALDRGDTGALARLRGSFGLAHWHAGSRRLMLATDHLGWKSVYHLALPERVAFASEYKAFYALADFVPQPCRQTLQEYQATWMCAATRTFLDNVQSVPNGCALTIARDQPAQTHRYWHIAAGKSAGRSRRESARLVRDTLVDVVARQARGFDRVGLTLSGGLDAPIVAALLRRHAPQVEVHAYTVGTDDDDPEIVGARRVAQHFGMEHHPAHFKAADVPRLLPGLIWLTEDCTGREETLLQYIVYERMSSAESCVFTGYGADGLFGGMPRHRLVYLAERLRPLRKSLLEVFQLTQSGAVPESALGRVLGRLALGAEQIAPPPVRGVDRPTRVDEPVDLNRYLSNSLRTKVASARFLEPLEEASRTAARHPFYDIDLIELADRIPSRHKIGWTTGKPILRNAFSDLLPSFVLERRKMIQRVRHDTELSDVLDGMCDRLLTKDAVESRRLFEWDYVAKLRQRRAAGPYSTVRIHRLWALLAAEIWARMFIDARKQLSVPRNGWSLASMQGIADFAQGLTAGAATAVAPRRIAAQAAL